MAGAGSTPRKYSLSTNSNALHLQPATNNLRSRTAVLTKREFAADVLRLFTPTDIPDQDGAPKAVFFVRDVLLAMCTIGRLVYRAT